MASNQSASSKTGTATGTATATANANANNSLLSNLFMAITNLKKAGSPTSSSFETYIAKTNSNLTNISSSTPSASSSVNSIISQLNNPNVSSKTINKIITQLSSAFFKNGGNSSNTTTSGTSPTHSSTTNNTALACPPCQLCPLCPACQLCPLCPSCPACICPSCTISSSCPENLNLTDSLVITNTSVTPNNKYQLIMQNDGNLVQYSNGSACWASNTSKPIANNAFICNPTTSSSSIISKNGIFTAIMKNDGNFVIYNLGYPIFATNTSQTTYLSSGTFSNSNSNSTSVILASSNGVFALSMYNTGIITISQQISVTNGGISVSILWNSSSNGSTCSPVIAGKGNPLAG